MSTAWGVGILTWNAPKQYLETAQALQEHLQGIYTPYLLDNGSDEPTPGLTGVPVQIIRAPHNLGAGGGLSALIRHLLNEGHNRILCLEDDWLLERGLVLDHVAGLLDIDAVGQVRLAQRADAPSAKYWTYGLTNPAEIATALAEGAGPRRRYADGLYHAGHLFWSSNPFACRRHVAERFLLGSLHELAIGRPYFDADLTTITTFPGYFRHVGQIRERRDQPGWKK